MNHDVQDITFEQAAAIGHDQRAPHPLAGLIPWVVSGAVHATALLLMLTIVFIAKEEPIEYPPVVVPYREPPPDRKPDPQQKAFSLLPPKVEIPSVNEPDKTEARTASVIDRPTIDMPDEPLQVSTGVALPTLTESNSPAAFTMPTVIGPGAGPGMYSGRTPGSIKSRSKIYGNSRDGEVSVVGALNWFKRHQSPDGRWDAEHYVQNCTDGAKCEPGSLMGYTAAEVNTAMTGYALLCFLGHGHDQRSPNPYRTVVAKGLDHLLSIQKPDGRFGERNYEHAIATMAVVEALAMTNDPNLRSPAQQGIDVILAHQNQDPGGGLGWDYVGPSARNDASVTGWNVMALKSAYAAGLTVRGGLTGAKRWLEQAWKANNDGQAGRADWRTLVSASDGSVLSYGWPTGGTSFEEKAYGHRNMAPVGLACAAFLGHDANDPMLRTMANWVMRNQLPTSYPCNTYYLYYNTMGMFQLNGPQWKAWNARVRDMLVNAQRRDQGCLRGSWDWQGTQFHGSDIGRVLSTAYCTLSLEVYYRYALAHGEKVRGP